MQVPRPRTLILALQVSSRVAWLEDSLSPSRDGCRTNSKDVHLTFRDLAEEMLQYRGISERLEDRMMNVSEGVSL